VGQPLIGNGVPQSDTITVNVADLTPYVPPTQEQPGQAKPQTQQDQSIVDQQQSWWKQGFETAKPVLEAQTGMQIGALKGAGKTVKGLSAGMTKIDNLIFDALNRVAGTHIQEFDAVGELLPDEMLQSKTPAEKTGEAMETVMEFMAADLAAAKGLSAAAKYKQVGQIASMLEKYPKITYLLEHGIQAARNGAVAGGQEFTKTGGDLDESVKSGAVVGALGAAGSLLGDAIKAVHLPYSKTDATASLLA
jgi:hypothetical protein